MTHEELASSLEDLSVNNPRSGVRFWEASRCSDFCAKRSLPVPAAATGASTSNASSGIVRGRADMGTRGVARAMEGGGSVWRPHIPDEVLSTILAFMPLRSILRCRTVGKRWNSLSQESLFRETYSRVSGELSTHFLQLMEQSPTFAGSQVVSSAGGLLLVNCFAQNSDEMYMANPMMATLKRIPPMMGVGGRYHFTVVGMVMNVETGVYSVLAVQEGIRPVQLQVFESSMGAWQWTGSWTVRLCGRQPTGAAGPISFHVLRAAMHQGALHCLSVTAYRNFLVMRFDPVSRDWFELPGLLPLTSNFYDFRCKPFLFENRGRLVLAGARITSPTSLCLNVWSYDDTSAKWTELACAHQLEEEDEVCGVSYSDTTLLYMDGSGDHLCLGMIPNFRFPEPKVLIYDMCENRWICPRVLEECEAANRIVYWHNRAFFYEPRAVTV